MKLTSCFTRPVSDQHVWTYPCLGLAKDRHNLIVLFESPRIGTILSVGYSPYYYIGYRETAWDMSYFEPFYGSVTITGHNDNGKTIVEGATGAVGRV